MHAKALNIPTPRWALPLLGPARYKGARGGRGSGKSHFFAEALVEEHVADPYQESVCIREVQKSLKFSAKKLIETKIAALGVGHLFDVQLTEIKRKGKNGFKTGIIIFQGMQDHTADSIKSLEGFKRAWGEEAQSLSRRSLDMLLPTIRADGSEIWLSWNPESETDPVDQLMWGPNKDPDAVTVHVNYYDNPWFPETLRKEMEKHRVRNPDSFGHVWLGEYASITDAQIFKGKYRVEAFTPGPDWHGPYHGLDFGFAADPTVAVRVWIHSDRLFIEYDAGRAELELDATAGYMSRAIPGIEKHTVRADSARPESISYLKRHGLPKIEAATKWSGSVEDGIAHLKSYQEIVIHTRCEIMQKEARLYRYKVDKKTGDILPVIVDADNHGWDAVRYALGPLIKESRPNWAGVM